MMNSFMRPNAQVNAEMHSFLKDKQAWENAIAMYQGPDPLDHWYNYICWYENHIHGDPEKKFRDTLERCLTLFEHSDYYGHDPRIVRLWLKYINLQADRLHFYQVLHQRSVGRHEAAFYIHWAGYYESINAYKEAESVYNMGFQEKAQPYAELHHAYSKFLYTRSLAVQAQDSLQIKLPQMHLSQHQHAHGSYQHSHTQLQPQPQSQPQQQQPQHQPLLQQQQQQPQPLIQQQPQPLLQQQSQPLLQQQQQQQPPPPSQPLLQQPSSSLSAPLTVNHQSPLPSSLPAPLPAPAHLSPAQSHQVHNYRQHGNYQSQHQLHPQTHPQQAHVHPHPHVHAHAHAHAHSHIHQHGLQAPLSHEHLYQHQLHHQQHHENFQHQHHQQQHQMPLHHSIHPHYPHIHHTHQQQMPNIIQHSQEHHPQHHHEHEQHQHELQHEHEMQHHLQQQHEMYETMDLSMNRMNYHVQQIEGISSQNVPNAVPIEQQLPPSNMPAIDHFQELQHQELQQQHMYEQQLQQQQQQQQQQQEQGQMQQQEQLQHQRQQEQMQMHQQEQLQQQQQQQQEQEQQQDQHQKQQQEQHQEPQHQKGQHQHQQHQEDQGQTHMDMEMQQQYEHERRHPYEYEHVHEYQHDFNYEQQQQEEGQGQEEEHFSIQPELNNTNIEKTGIGGIILPENFVTFCRNNFEGWKPILFLAEPVDPTRICHYRKDLVYPGDGDEYSPEEIHARKYAAQIKQSMLNALTQDVLGNDSSQSQQYEEIGKVVEGVMQVEKTDPEPYVYYDSETQYNPEMFVPPINTPEPNVDQYEMQYDNEQQQIETAGEDNIPHTESNVINEGFIQHEEQQQHVSGSALGDLEEQIEASTILLTLSSAQDRVPKEPIKLKLKKERLQESNSLNSNSYPAYSVYQQDITSPISRPQHSSHKSNHSFHPYLLGQTSTPKTSSKRNKKLKRVSKYSTVNECSSSNSSSADGIPSCSSNVRNLKAKSRASTVIQNATFNDNANYSFSSAAALDNSNCSVSSGLGRSNFREATVVNNSTAADFSTYQENSYFATQHDTEAKERRLSKALETIERHMTKDTIDPFNSELCRAFLTKIGFPATHNDGNSNYKVIQTPLPKILNSKPLTLPDGVCFNVDKEVGRGSYGSVYKAVDVNTGALVALKYQKPPNTWEIYICDQVLKRISSRNVLPGLMDISTAIIAPNASLIATEYTAFGSLLDINNKLRQSTTKVMHESLVMHFSAQICNIIYHLHSNKIIHADIKPDNFLLMYVPSTELHHPSLRLIDFGCAIDMSLFPDKDRTKFHKIIQTDGFTCIEMQEGRPWSYETDLFCVAGTVHVMLLGEYMQLQKRAGVWDIKQKLPRYLKKNVWSKFFGDILNINGGELPDLFNMYQIFTMEAQKMESELQTQLRTLKNILFKR